MSKEKSVGAIIFTNSPAKFLLLHYMGGHWDFVKGHPLEGESENQALFRELEEETGTKENNVEIIPGFKETINYFFKSKEETIFKEVSFFLLKSNTEKVKISSEHKGFKWLPFEEAVELATHKTPKDLLSKASSKIQSTNS